MKTCKLVAILLTAVLFLSSCGIIIINDGEKETTAPTVTTETPPETYIPPEYPVVADDRKEKAKERLNALPEADLDGLGIIIAAENESGSFFSDETGIYVDAVKYRNSLVSDKYNTSIVTLYKNATQIHTDIRNSKTSGHYFADFTVVAGNILGAYNSAGFIISLQALPYTDFTRDCYNRQAMEQLSVGSVIYGAVGALTETPEQLGCVYINKTALSSLGGTLDYRKVYDGEFTWDMLFEYQALADGDINAFVSTSDNGTLGLYSYMGAGRTFLSVSDGVLFPDFINDTTRQIIKNVRQLGYVRTYTVNTTVTETDEEGNPVESSVKLSGFPIFEKGYAISAFGLLGDMTSLKNAGFDWEVLPYPKLEGQEEYYSSTPTAAPVVTLLASSPNIDACGYVLQALSEVSYGYVQNEFVRYAMKNCSTGVYTPDMIDLVLENPVYDFCYMFGNTHAAIKNGTYSVLINAVNSPKDLSTFFTNKLKNELNKIIASYS